MKFLQIILPLIQKDGSFFALFGNVDFLLFVWFSYCSLNECKVLRAKILKWEYVMRRGGLQKICTSLCTIACFLNQRLWSYSRKSFLGKSPIVFYIVNGWGPKEPKEGAISGQNAFSNCCLYWSHPFQHFAKFQNRWLKKQAIDNSIVQCTICTNCTTRGHHWCHHGSSLVLPTSSAAPSAVSRLLSWKQGDSLPDHQCRHPSDPSGSFGWSWKYSCWCLLWVYSHVF